MRGLCLAMWTIFSMLFIGLLYFSYEVGYIQYVWSIDSSKLCFVVLSLFVFGHLRLGYLIYKDSVNDFRLEVGYELADTSMAIGMLGTVIGFMIMAASFTTVDFSDISNIKDLFALATNGMSTALYTTAFGLVSSILLRAGNFTVQRLMRF